MNLFLRLLMVFVKASLSGQRVSVFDTTIVKSRVMLTDQDMFAHMTNSRYFSFSDLATINYIIRTGSWKTLRKRALFPVVCSESVVFSRMLRAHQAFEIRTHLVGWTGTYLCLEHNFCRNDDVTACARIVARFASRKKEKITMEDIVALLGIEGNSPALPDTYNAMIADIDSARRQTAPERPGNGGR